MCIEFYWKHDTTKAGIQTFKQFVKVSLKIRVNLKTT